MQQISCNKTQCNLVWVKSGCRSGKQRQRQAGSTLLRVRSMCKHKCRDRQAHRFPLSGINKLAVCPSQLAARTQGQHKDALHVFPDCGTNSTLGEERRSVWKPCLPEKKGSKNHKRQADYANVYGKFRRVQRDTVEAQKFKRTQRMYKPKGSRSSG